MRITFVLNSPILSGGMRVIATHAEGLQRRGHRVTMVVLPLSLRQKLAAWKRHGEWPKVNAFATTFLDGDGVDLKLLRNRHPLTDADVPDADVVIATYWPTTEWVTAFSERKGAKVFFAQGYEVTPDDDPGPFDDAWRRPLHKIVVSRWLRDVAANQFGDTDVSLVPNTVDTTLFSGPARGKRPIPTVGFMYAGATWIKGCDLSLEAYRMARERVPELRLVAFGRERPRNAEWLADAQFTALPDQHAISSIYASCDVWLCPSRNEGFGLPLLEAMACHTPVIATPVGAAPEILAHGGGTLIEPENAAQLADAICDIAGLSDRAWRDTSEAAYETVQRGRWVEGVEDGYSWENATEQFEGALQHAIGGARSPNQTEGDRD